MRGLLIGFLVMLFLMAEACTAADNGSTGNDGTAAATEGIPYGVIESQLVPVAYSGGETFRYDVSYTGGLKLGELYLKVEKGDEKSRPDSYIIDALVTTENGMFSKAYPILDKHVTKVSGVGRLPYHYEVWQKEGYSYEAHRVMKFDQSGGKVYYQHNDNPIEVFDTGINIQNEFSSFLASRLMSLKSGHPFVVPTFADKKRNEVVVMVRGQQKLKKTVLGTVDTVLVEPIMKFSGLYDKRGDTVVWYTDDECRVPVQVNSKLLIGSLTARLVGYNNPACPKYDGALLDKYREQGLTFVH